MRTQVPGPDGKLSAVICESNTQIGCEATNHARKSDVLPKKEPAAGVKRDISASFT